LEHMFYCSVLYFLTLSCFVFPNKTDDALTVAIIAIIDIKHDLLLSLLVLFVSKLYDFRV